MSLAREARNVAYPIPTIFAARIGPTPKISVSMVPQASPSTPMRSSSSSAIRRSRARTSRTTSEASRLRTRPAGCCALARRNNLAAALVESCFPTGSKRRSRRRRVRGGGSQGTGALGDQVLPSFGEQPQDLKISAWPSGPSSGWTEASRSFRRAARALKVASSASFFRALPVESTLTREESLGCSRPPLARLRLGASGPRGARCHLLRPPQPNGVPGSV